MKNYAAFALSAVILIGVGFGFSSCKEDEPPVPPKLSFAESSMAVDEDAGVVEVEVVLDKPYGKDLNVEYDLGGTASDQDAVGSAGADYEVVGDHGVVVIPGGETSAVIELEIYSDDQFEETETIEISIVDVNTSDVEITAENETVVEITNDDAALQLSFSGPDVSVKEDDGSHIVELTLDKPAPQQLTINYTLGGSAIDSITAKEENRNPDYYINGVAGKLVIPQGETTGQIDIRIYSDLLLEDANPDTEPIDPETIVITVDEGGAVQMEDNELEISLGQEDGLLIALFWPDSTEQQYADMDLLMRVGPNTSEWLGILTGSASESNIGPELVFIPTAIRYEAYGMSYVYWGGTIDPLTFEVVYIDLIDGALEDPANTTVFEATYTAANKNPWTDATATKVVQTFTKTETGFSAPTAIEVPASGSRMGDADRFTSNFRRSAHMFMKDLRESLRRYE